MKFKNAKTGKSIEIPTNPNSVYQKFEIDPHLP